MPKIFDRNNEELGLVKRINENVWFKTQQSLLLWMANNPAGRELLCIDQDFPRIVEISKRHVKGYLGFFNKRYHFVYDFRVGAKWANIIRFKWFEFQKLALDYYGLGFLKYPMFPVAAIKNLAYTTYTFYPDPDPETTSVDGSVGQDYGLGSGQSWATLIAAAGTTANPSVDDINAFSFRCDNTTNNWQKMYRSIFLFDTSSIPDTDTINSAVMSLYGDGLKADALGVTPNINIYGSTPATNTNLVAGDFAQCGSVAYATAIAYGSYNVSAYNDFTFNATGIAAVSKTGVTKTSARNANYDVAATDPGWASAADHYINCFAADKTGTVNDPKLVVVTSSATLAGFLTLLGVGS